MRRLAILLAGVVLFSISLPSANANTVYAERCYTYVGPNNARAVTFCVALITDGTDWWGRARSLTPSGYSPINVAVGTLKYFSHDSNNNICWGDVSGGNHSCEGQGTNTITLSTSSNPPPANGTTNPHFGWTDHYCTSWANLDVLFSFTKTGDMQDTGDLNSWAITTPPCAS